MSSITGPIDPTDLANVSPPFDQTVSGVSPATALVEVRGDNGLLLPCARNPKEASSGSVTFVGITSLDGDHGATYAGGSVVVSSGVSDPSILQSAVLVAPATNAGGTATANITPTATGTCLVAVAVGPEYDTSWSIADDHTHTWNTHATATHDSATNRYMQAWWASSNTTAQVAVTLTGNAWYAHGLIVVEVGSISASTPYDTGVSADVLGGDAMTTGTLTTAQATEMLIGVIATGSTGGGTATISAGTNYTLDGQLQITSTCKMGIQHRLVTSQGGYVETYGLDPAPTTGSVGVILLAFRGA